MATFTSSLPDQLLNQLTDKATKLAVPKNKILERALVLYLEHLERLEYIQSYRKAGQDDEIMMIAEEGMADYLKQIEEYESR